MNGWISFPRKVEDLSAQSKADLLIARLQLYGKDFTNVICIIGDNCSTNKRVADIIGVPLVGCASHRFNLAVQKYLSAYEREMTKVSNVRRKLRTIKTTAKLRKSTTASYT